MSDYDFEAYHDWEYLADYFDIEISEEKVDRAVEKLKEKDLWNSNSENDIFWDLEFPMFFNRKDVERKLKLHELHVMIYEMAFDVLEDREDHGEKIQAIRYFVESYVEEAMTMSDIFYAKLSEIDNDYVFLNYLANNLEDLWW